MAFNRKVLFIVLLLTVGAAKLGAKGLPPAEHLQVTLLTVDQGSGVDKRFGHTIMRLIDTRNGASTLFNWGTFSFDSPSFITDFVRGKLTYWLAINSYQGTIRHYRDREKRSVYEDHLALSLAQKKSLLALLAKNMKPENRDYQYDFFYDNCSTIPRDYLDKALKGAFYAFSRERTPQMRTFREVVLRDLAEWRLLPIGVDAILNSSADRHLDAWLEMFHPLMLRRHLLEMPRVDADGNMVPGTKLVTASRQLVKGGSYPSRRYGFQLGFGIGLVVLLIVSFGAGISSLCLRVLWALFALMFALTGTLGCFLSWAWVYSDHLVLPANANLWLFFASDLVLSLYCVYRSLRPLGATAFLVRSYAFLHFAACCGMVFLYSVDYFVQNIEHTVYWLVPLYLLAFARLMRRNISSLSS